MYLLLAIISVVVGMSVSPGKISDVPFSELTLRMLFGSLFEVVCYCGAVYFGSKSLETDRIWPWRWTLPYLGNILLRAGLSALLIYGVATFIEEKDLDGWRSIAALVVGGILLLAIFFSSDLDYFKEKTEAEKPNKQ